MHRSLKLIQLLQKPERTAACVSRQRTPARLEHTNFCCNSCIGRPVTDPFSDCYKGSNHSSYPSLLPNELGSRDYRDEWRELCKCAAYWKGDTQGGQEAVYCPRSCPSLSSLQQSAKGSRNNRYPEDTDDGLTLLARPGKCRAVIG